MCVCVTLSTHVCESVYVCSVSSILRIPTQQGTQECLVSDTLDHSPYHTTRRTVILLSGRSVLGDLMPQQRRVFLRHRGDVYFFSHFPGFIFLGDPLGRGGTRRSRIRIRIRTCSKSIIRIRIRTPSPTPVRTTDPGTSTCRVFPKFKMCSTGNTFIITIPFFTLLSPFYGPNPSGIPSLEGTLKKN
jgi:hypothetical protein